MLSSYMTCVAVVVTKISVQCRTGILYILLLVKFRVYAGRCWLVVFQSVYRSSTSHSTLMPPTLFRSQGASSHLRNLRTVYTTVLLYQKENLSFVNILSQFVVMKVVSSLWYGSKLAAALLLPMFNENITRSNCYWRQALCCESPCWWEQLVSSSNDQQALLDLSNQVLRLL